MVEKEYHNQNQILDEELSILITSMQELEVNDTKNNIKLKPFAQITITCIIMQHIKHMKQMRWIAQIESEKR